MFNIINLSGKTINFSLVSGGALAIPAGESTSEDLTKKGHLITEKDLNALVKFSHGRDSLKVKLTGVAKDAKSPTHDVSKLVAEKDEALANVASLKKDNTELSSKLEEQNKALAELQEQNEQLQTAKSDAEKEAKDAKAALSKLEKAAKKTAKE
ncbi:hypothetical protein [Pseudoalteromonas ruthenica]|uniref:hypothetical protein n=1 Tax=Pseudoalteromonas ruthenica TaxID=151081 RepID=UPI00110AADCE|nr:hypothetical protein [Pseudoalteromonas ruthenica]TMO87709.1 hypothetical protein CWC12_10550 [Pseudoalteromonas ruthenica]TMP21514.1 hypothetical protein CWC06_18375 [Pseudoalteromonas ruthenica]